tara:strand:- start:62 stop:451 length:390 start_codon:yes stop_codon:yes gene_type:complete
MLLGASNPVGVGSSINFIGNYAYAYSGQLNSTSGSITLLDFVVPNANFIDATVQFGFGGTRSNDDERAEIYIDGELVAANLYNNNYERAELNDFKVLLAPNAHVEIKIVKVSGSGTVPSFAWVRGRVYE